MRIHTLSVPILVASLSATMLGGCSADPALKAGASTGRFDDGTGDSSNILRPGVSPGEVSSTSISSVGPETSQVQEGLEVNRDASRPIARDTEAASPVPSDPVMVPPRSDNTSGTPSSGDSDPNRGGAPVYSPEEALLPTPILASPGDGPMVDDEEVSSIEETISKDRATMPLLIGASTSVEYPSGPRGSIPSNGPGEGIELAVLPLPISANPREFTEPTSPQSTPEVSDRPPVAGGTSPKAPIQSPQSTISARTGAGLEVSCGTSSRFTSRLRRRLECTLQPVERDPSVSIFKSARDMLQEFSFRACPSSQVEKALSPPKSPYPSILFIIDERYLAACLTAHKNLTIADPATSALLGL